MPIVHLRVQFTTKSHFSDILKIVQIFTRENVYEARGGYYY